MKLYAKKEIVRTYYKEIYEPYTLKTMTSNTDPEGVVSTNLSTSTYSLEPYILFWNRQYSYDNYAFRGNDKYVQYTFPKLLKQGTYTLSFWAYTQQNVTTPSYQFIAIYEDNSSEVVYTIGQIPTSSTNYSKTFTTTKKLKAIKLNIPTVSASSASYIVTTIGSFKLTMDGGLMAYSETIPSTQDDYDFYSEKIVWSVPKETVTKYWKYVDALWTQPVLTANGTLGGSSFAVYCPSDETSSYPPYRAFDGNTSTQVVTHSTPFTIYNPTPLNITKFQLIHSASWQYYKGGTIQGSDDNTNWENIVTIGANLTNWDLSSNTKYYNYYKILQPNGGDFQPHEITLTATQRTIIEGTEDDYDFTTTADIYYASMQGGN